MAVQVQDVVDAARTRHWSFTDLVLGDGAALLFLNQRIRTHLANHGAKIEGLVGTSMEYAISTANGALVGLGLGWEQSLVFPLGNQALIPQTIDTYADGWPVHVDPATNVPYIDTSEPAIAGDPFGASGGVPGFPLPIDMIRLITVALIYNNAPGTIIPCDIVQEPQRFTTLPGRNPTCFVSGNRLVPLLPLAGAINNSADRWFNVTAIQISYVAVQSLATLEDTLNLPVVLVEALTADMALFFANQSKVCPPADKQALRLEATECATKIGAAALDLIGEAENDQVSYHG